MTSLNHIPDPSADDFKKQVNFTDFFCNQCILANSISGCQKNRGQCGKSAQVAALQDLSIHYLKGIAQFAVKLPFDEIPTIIQEHFITTLFATLPNVNYFDDFFINNQFESAKFRDIVKNKYLEKNQLTEDLKKEPASFNFIGKNLNKYQYIQLLNQGKLSGIKNRASKFGSDVVNLGEYCFNSLRGITFYFYLVMDLCRFKPDILKLAERQEVIKEIIQTLANLSLDKCQNDIELFKISQQIGVLSQKVLEMLDKCNAAIFGNPEPTSVQTQPISGQCILVTGHNLLDLYRILQLTDKTGIRVYTQGELFSGHSYPEIKKFKHLAGNIANSSTNEISEISSFPGPIVVTTGFFPDIDKKHIEKFYSIGLLQQYDIKHVEAGQYQPIIMDALQNTGYSKQLDASAEKFKETVGYHHSHLAKQLPKFVKAYKDGQIKYFFLITGGDNRDPKQKYYRELILALPKQSIVLIAGSIKSRLRELKLGNVEKTDIPRLIDIGQCNDVFTAIFFYKQIASQLKLSITKKPFYYFISWFDAKSTLILQYLLSQGITTLKFGPIFPLFLNSKILSIINQDKDKQFVKEISTVVYDTKEIEEK